MSNGIVLTDGTTTIDLRRGDTPTGIYCYDWSDLLGAPAKRGRSRPIPGVRGAAVRPRVAGELRALLQVRAVAETHVECVELLDGLYALIDQDAPLEVTVHRDTLDPLAGVLQVVDPDRPTFVTAHAATLVIDTVVPAGRLEAPS